MRITGIKETCLYVSDLEETERFYVSILGFKLISKIRGRHVFFRVDDQVLLCFNPETTRNEMQLPPHYANGPQHVAFSVDPDEYDTSKEEILSKGVEITHEQNWGSEAIRSFYFEDPDGNVLEIVTEGLWD